MTEKAEVREASPEVLGVGPSCQLSVPPPRLPPPMPRSPSCSNVGVREWSQQLRPGVSVREWSQQPRPGVSVRGRFLGRTWPSGGEFATCVADNAVATEFL
ncbi:hypothetical protein VitviT2T_002328 [Vitis vinifera]|uniref:Uncharacterized protein n=1 Tax=Vitis vinifera TaxID=29760 RepID=A0ABY9BI91_VITVI|nr:hypothetical protein VitviT2T_002328 [Vitis vinifera]